MKDYDNPYRQQLEFLDQVRACRKCRPEPEQREKPVKETSEKYSGEFKEETKAIVALLECAEKRLLDSERKIEELLSRYQEQQNATAEAYELQTELTNYIMMNLRIPNELKTEISDRSAAVKAAIKASKAKEG